MDQSYMQIIQDLTEKVNDLSAIVLQRVYQEKTLDFQFPECDGIHRTTVVPGLEIESFPEPLEFIPDLEKDFFRISLAIKARKDIIYGCPKFTGMNYQPPPLNDAAPTSVKRTDAMLYKIQTSLARLTRPLDHYMYEQIRQRRLVDLDNDGEIILVETMRTMLADLASTITQDRIDIMHKIMDLLGRAPQLVESSMKSLFTEDQLITMISTKKTATRSRTQRKCPFRQRQQPGYGYPAATAPIQQAALAQHQPNTSNNQGGQSQGKRSQNIPQKGKNSGAEYSKLRPPTGEDVSLSRAHGRGPPADVPPPSFQEEDDPGGERGHQKGGKSSLVEESYQGGEGENSRVLQQPLHDPKVDRRPPPSIGSPGVQQPYGGVLLQDEDPGIGMQDDQEEGLHGVPGLGRRLHACSNPSDVQEIPEICMERSDIPIPRPPFRAIFKPSYLYQGPRTSPNMGQRSGHTSLGILGQPFDNRGVQEEVLGEHREILFPVDQPGIQNQHEEVEPDTIPINISFGDSNQFQIDEPKDPQGQDQISPQESQQTSEDGLDDVERSGELHCYIKSSSPKASCWKICVDLFRKHHVDFLCQEVWRNHLKSIIEDFRRHLVTLSEIEYPTANDVIPNIPQSCRCAKNTDCSNGVVSIGRNFQKDRKKVCDSVMGISNLVSRLLETNTRRSCNDTGNGDHSRPQKRKIPTDGQQTMVAIGLEDQRSSLENQGYNKEAIALLLPNERLVKRRARNSTIQQKFIDWLEVKNK
ncbi:hypothetical protein AYI69_g8916, partial [Smittium culicis]